MHAHIIFPGNRNSLLSGINFTESGSKLPENLGVIRLGTQKNATDCHGFTLI
jgi:hypothetical protein